MAEPRSTFEQFAPIAPAAPAPARPTDARTLRVDTGRTPKTEPGRRRFQRKERRKPVPVALPSTRRYRQTVQRIDVWTVLKMSTCFYLCALVVTLLAAIVLWYAARTMGLVDNFESVMKTLFNWKDFELVAFRMLRAITLIGVVITSLMIVMTTLAAAFYNVFSEMLGGVELTVLEEELDRR